MLDTSTVSPSSQAERKRAICIRELEKKYNNDYQALTHIDLDVLQGEIFALLGPNGAGKTTLISTICGIVKASSGSIEVFGLDNVKDYRKVRAEIGLVPQELTTDAFETVWNTVSFSRGLFGKPRDPDFIEQTLKRLSLWDKKDSEIRTLSGGMKRRVMIAKALSHEPKILFLDEPSAGVDVELRKSMWEEIRKLRDSGVTIILTTHYIEEAEEMADRVGVINKGKMIVIEEKNELMKKLGKKELVINLYDGVEEVPKPLSDFNLSLMAEGTQLVFTYDPSLETNNIADLLDRLKKNGLRCRDLQSRQSSLEEIFVQLVGEK